MKAENYCSNLEIIQIVKEEAARKKSYTFVAQTIKTCLHIISILRFIIISARDCSNAGFSDPSSYPKTFPFLFI